MIHEANRAMIAAALSPFASPYVEWERQRMSAQHEADAIQQHYARLLAGPIDPKRIKMQFQAIDTATRPHRFTMRRKIRRMVRP